MNPDGGSRLRPWLTFEGRKREAPPTPCRRGLSLPIVLGPWIPRPGRPAYRPKADASARRVSGRMSNPLFSKGLWIENRDPRDAV